MLAYGGGPDGAVILLPDPHRLFDIFCPCYHTVLSTVDVAWAKVMTGSIDLDPPIVPKVVVMPRSTPDPNEFDSDLDICLRDDDGHAFGGSHVGKEEFGIVVVRPDGLLAAIVSGEDGLRQYLNGFCGEAYPVSSGLCDRIKSPVLTVGHMNEL
ncbi:hypothetical protein PAXINDRAFT_17148 [Paxillus involutus ATCC 200175]|uniref:Uncharacterized protein n=1 Tax=Paxillus involutus ATCC 200175 TaxID=664439 RepID=A0A0C9TPT6_PAXIN|nr:hypothetical protein PAXINDRAFT_17148 [Paxillus involutus ATCC 200175]